MCSRRLREEQNPCFWPCTTNINIGLQSYGLATVMWSLKSRHLVSVQSQTVSNKWGTKGKRRRAELILRVSRLLLHSGALTFILTATTRQVTSGDTRGKRRKEKCLLRWQMHTNSYFVRTWQKCTQVICDIRITNVTRQSWQRLKSCRLPYGLLTRGEDFNVTCSDFL